MFHSVTNVFGRNFVIWVFKNYGNPQSCFKKATNCNSFQNAHPKHQRIWQEFMVLLVAKIVMYVHSLSDKLHMTKQNYNGMSAAFFLLYQLQPKSPHTFARFLIAPM